jgi:ribosomal protein S18 acetylase RimI-like enzyme
MLQGTLRKPFVVSFKYMYIDDLCVDSACRGKGIGKKLFAHVCKEAKALGCRDITLNVWEGNDSARAFYESLGMKVQKTTMEITL